MASHKKGIGDTGFGDRAAELGACWTFNWTERPTEATGVEFVPIAWGTHGDLSGTTVLPPPGTATTLLGFNEPDDTAKANLSVDEVLDIWPRLEATGLRLGSPGVTGNELAGGWLEAFLRGAAARRLRVDFIAVHWYGPLEAAGVVGGLETHLRAIHDRYGLPLWLTEFGALNWEDDTRWSQEAVTGFIRAAVPMLEALPFLERYAWFATRTTEWASYRLSSLFDDSGALTATGRAYRDAA